MARFKHNSSDVFHCCDFFFFFFTPNSLAKLLLYKCEKMTVTIKCVSMSVVADRILGARLHPKKIMYKKHVHHVVIIVVIKLLSFHSFRKER